MKRSLVDQIELSPAGGRLKLDDLTLDTTGDYNRISALLQNIAYLSQAIQQLQVASISYINFAGLVSIGALTVGIIRPVLLVEIFAPYALSIVFIFLIQLYTDIERLTTIREVLEAHANSKMPAPAFLGLNERSSKYRGRHSVRLIAVLLALPLGLFAYHSITAMAALVSTANRHERLALEFFRCANYVGLGFCLLVIAWALCEMFQAHGDAILEVRDTLGDPPQITKACPKANVTQRAT